jgi:hypothetical protein
MKFHLTVTFFSQRINIFLQLCADDGKFKVHQNHIIGNYDRNIIYSAFFSTNVFPRVLCIYTEKRNRLGHIHFFCAPSDRKWLTVMIRKLDSNGSVICHNRWSDRLIQAIFCSSRTILIIWFKYFGFIVLNVPSRLG